MDCVDEPVRRDDPVRVRGDFDAPSRWLWLFKWCVLAAPHYPILILLYLAYPPVTVAAGEAAAWTAMASCNAASRSAQPWTSPIA